MTYAPSREAECLPAQNSRPGRINRAFLSGPLFSDQKREGNSAESFHPHGIRRLSLAIINHAIRDLIENGRHSHGAERWLLSREFDRLDNLLW